MRRHIRKIHRKLRKHHKRIMNFLQAVRLYGMPVGV
jgi:hypothetical protein